MQRSSHTPLLALVGPLAAEGQVGLAQFACTCKALPAVLALVGLFSALAQLVPAQAACECKRLTALLVSYRAACECKRRTALLALVGCSHRSFHPKWKVSLVMGSLLIQCPPPSVVSLHVRMLHVRMFKAGFPD